jgi:transmembrane sensor
MVDEKRLNELWDSHLANKLTSEEYQELMHMIQSGAYDQMIKDKIERLILEDQNEILLDPLDAEEIIHNIHSSDKEYARVTEFRPKRFYILRVAAAASLISLIVLGTFLWFNKGEQKEVAQTGVRKHNYKDEVLPGGNKAVLTLGDGSTIVLDDAQNGMLTQQGATKVIKLGGKLAYDPAGTGSTEVVFNTIATPRGGQYQIELPDGSLVWLNAASSIRFPTAFAGKERRVEISGEVYFEVAKNKAMPFIVSVIGAEVQVLGTHFNVMAYKEEHAVKTTLLEGSVRFVSGNNTSLLKPGQQSQLTKEGEVKVVNDVDIEEVLAWKNGMFYFENADIETVLKQVSRWYDVEVEYQTQRGIKRQFNGEIPRSSKLSDVLKVLELTSNKKFEIEGKKVIVKM